MRLQWVSVRRVSAVAGHLAAASVGGAAGPSQSPAGHVEALVSGLGRPEFAPRQAAAEELRGSEWAAPWVRQASASPDPEVRLAASALLGEYASRRRERDRAAWPEYATAGRIDYVVDAMVAARATDDAAAWGALIARCQAMAERARSGVGVKIKDVSAEHLDESAEYTESWAPPIGSEKMSRRILTQSVDSKSQLNPDVLVCQGDATLRYFGKGGKQSDLFVCNGDVKQISNLDASILICGGDVSVWHIDRSVVIARGRVTYGRLTDSVVLQHQGDDFGMLTGFRPEHAGLSVAEHEGRPQIGSDVRSLWYRDGLRGGDVVTGVNGEAAPDLKAFTALFRRAHASGEPIRFGVLRHGKATELTVYQD